MTAPRWNIRIKKWVVAQFLEIPTPSWNSSHSLAYEIIHPYKNWQPHTLVPFSPSEMAHTLSCGVCFSLNESTSYLSLCLSLNSFCNETSRTWASLSPETRCVISVGRLWVLARFESQLHGFKSQSEVHVFIVKLHIFFWKMCLPHGFNLTIATKIPYKHFRVEENNILRTNECSIMKKNFLRAPKNELQRGLKSLFLFRLWETKGKSLGNR